MNIKQTPMESITFPKIDRSHSSSATTVISGVVGLDSLLPELSGLGRTVLAEADVDQEIAIVEIGLEIGSCLLRGPFVDWPCAGINAVPAA